MKLTLENNERILASVKKTKVFGSSKRQHQLLKYLLDETAAGRGEKIKAYSIAVDILGRDESFDNAIDSITRVEMHRLRKNLSLFNMLQNEFTITLPKAQFIPIVEAKKPQPSLPPPKQIAQTRSMRSYTKLITLAFVLCVAIFAAALYTRINSPTDTTFSARILFPAASVTNASVDTITAASIANEIKYKLANDPFVDIKNNGPHDYKLNIEISDANSAGNKIATVFIYEEDGTLAWSNTYGLNDKALNSITEENLHRKFQRIAQHVYDDAFSLRGKFTHYHANNTNISRNRRCLYQCYFDSSSFTVTDIPKYFDTHLLSCLDSRLTNVPRDKHRIHVIRADVYLSSVYGALPFQTKNPLEKAEVELNIAQQYGFNSDVYLHARLKLESERVPRNIKTIRTILDDMRRLYPDNGNLNYLRAYTFAEYFVDWPVVLPLADKFIQQSGSEFSNAHLFYIYYYIQRGDWESAFQRYNLMKSNSTKSHLAHGVIITCNLSYFTPKDNFAQRLIDKNISTPETFTAYIKKRRLHVTLEAQMLKPEMFENCPLFSKA